jgi:hypothetical protein
MQAVTDKVGVRLTQHAIGRGVSRWVPVIGALGVGAYAYYDTGQVAHTAIDLFEREIHFESPQEIESKRDRRLWGHSGGSKFDQRLWERASLKNDFSRIKEPSRPRRCR